MSVVNRSNWFIPGGRNDDNLKQMIKVTHLPRFISRFQKLESFEPSLSVLYSAMIFKELALVTICVLQIHTTTSFSYFITFVNHNCDTPVGM